MFTTDPRGALKATLIHSNLQAIEALPDGMLVDANSAIQKLGDKGKAELLQEVAETTDPHTTPTQPIGQTEAEARFERLRERAEESLTPAKKKTTSAGAASGTTPTPSSAKAMTPMMSLEEQKRIKAQEAAQKAAKEAEEKRIAVLTEGRRLGFYTGPI